MSEIQLRAKVRQLRELEALIEEARQDAEGIRDEIKAHMGDTEEMRAGEYKITWKPITSTRLDTTALKKAIPDLVSRFTTTTTTRRFCIN